MDWERTTCLRHMCFFVFFCAFGEMSEPLSWKKRAYMGLLIPISQSTDPNHGSSIIERWTRRRITHERLYVVLAHERLTYPCEELNLPH